MVPSSPSLSSRTLPSLEEVKTAPLAELVDLGNFLRERSSAAARFPNLDFSDAALSRTKDLQQALEKRVREESALVHAHASYLLKAALLLPQAPHLDDLLESLAIRHDVCSRYACKESSAIAHYREHRRSYQILLQRTAHVAYGTQGSRATNVTKGAPVAKKIKTSNVAKGTVGKKYPPYQDLVQQMSSRQEQDGLGSIRASPDSLLDTLLELAIYLSSATAATQLIYRLVMRG